ncbi:protein phosphatase 1 regulatory subunit 3C-like [Pristis pectinata]|uniref:protein phosphatase 1 regulatory subunit 3C-like n=1 Tax=Pristis pectinata TaxID=685728 RepID=UPI00223D9D4B|nr:protein phosphatase 1 regulatory subunit 3C-like [Pristis pectinata]
MGLCLLMQLHNIYNMGGAHSAHRVNGCKSVHLLNLLFKLFVAVMLRSPLARCGGGGAPVAVGAGRRRAEVPSVCAPAAELCGPRPLGGRVGSGLVSVSGPAAPQPSPAAEPSPRNLTACCFQLPHPPVMPVDFARRLCLNHSPPLRSFLNHQDFGGVNRSRLKPLRSCLNLRNTECLDKEEWKTCPRSSIEKKKVVFADAKGFSLTAVRMFSELEDDLSDLQFELSDLADCDPRPVKNEKLSLDFHLPSANYLSLRSRLQENFVCLEDCVVQEKFISGTVKVKNLGYEKKVMIRITFDSWKSFQDIECIYLSNAYGFMDVDTFCFQIHLPECLQPHEKIEFCVSFKCGQDTFWDNNNEENYKITGGGWQKAGRKTLYAEDSSHYNIRGRAQEVDFEQFGSPRSADVIFSQWQSWGRFDSCAYW